MSFRLASCRKRIHADELTSAAKSRATWSQIGVALLAGAAAAAAAAAANSYTTQSYRTHMRTPHGTYSWVTSYRDNSLGQVAAAGSITAGVVGVNSVQKRLVPAPMDHGSFAFDVVIYNDGDAPANFDNGADNPDAAWYYPDPKTVAKWIDRFGRERLKATRAAYVRQDGPARRPVSMN
jgi:hypothetical protein